MAQQNYGLPTEYAAKSFGLLGGDHASFHYTETGSVTWKYGASGSVGINYDTFGVSIDIDVTARVTSGHTNMISFSVGPLPSQITTVHTFVIYTKGFSFTEPNGISDDSNNKDGIEFHIWDLGPI